MRRWLTMLLAAGLGTVLIPTAFAVFAWWSWGRVVSPESMDDAPRRGAGLFVVFSPLFLALAVGYFGAVAAFLRTIGRLSLISIFVCNALASIVIGLSFAALSGFDKVFPTLLVEGALWSMVALTLGALAGWAVGRWRLD